MILSSSLILGHLAPSIQLLAGNLNLPDNLQKICFVDGKSLRLENNGCEHPNNHCFAG